MQSEELVKSVSSALRDELQLRAVLCGAAERPLAEDAASSDAALFRELCLPFGEHARERFYQAAARAFEREGDSDQPENRSAAPVVRKSRALAMVGLAMAACAALAFGSVLFFSGAREENLRPRYALEVRGGDRLQRGGVSANAARLELRPDSEIELVARPDQSAPAAEEARLFSCRAGTCSFVPAQAERSTAGAFRVAGTARDLGLEQPGEYRLVLFVGDADALPTGANAAAQSLAAVARSDERALVAVFEQDVRILAATPGTL